MRVSAAGTVMQGWRPAELRRSLGQVLLAVEQWQQQAAAGTEQKAAEMSLTDRACRRL
ncbi:hypothetical protein [Xenorhabdus bovienii]|uniref:hypothetical protein n=1 Tax=Xenorhabdus bovienii TaxID=40576 RepID=UPI003DA329C6